MTEEERIPEEETPDSEEEIPISEEESPDSEEEIPISEEESPDSEEEIPITEEETPDSEEEIPIAEEETPDSEEEIPITEEDVPEIEQKSSEPILDVSVTEVDNQEAELTFEDTESKDVESEMAELADLEGLSEAELAELEEFSEDELLDIQEAMEENRQNELGEKTDSMVNSEGVTIDPATGEEIQPEVEFNPEIDDDLERRMQEELEAKKKAQGVKTVTRDQFMAYLADRRAKIMYHALWHIVFNVDDHIIDKQSLYDVLKEVTSKNAVEVLEEHKFYFGLGFILRLKFLDQKVIIFKKGKLKLNMSAEMLQDMLQYIGDPISERPIITDGEKKRMFEDFLNDDFLDI